MRDEKRLPILPLLALALGLTMLVSGLLIAGSTLAAPANHSLHQPQGGLPCDQRQFDVDASNHPANQSITATVAIQNFCFTTRVLTITVGDTVAWDNYDQIGHNASTLNSGSIPPEPFQTAYAISPTNRIVSRTFTLAGVYDYLCDPHPFMTARIVVLPAPVAINIQGFTFAPQVLTVTVGTRVQWTNRDAASHTVNSTSPPGVLNSGNLAQNAIYSYTFSTAGTYDYQCNIHTGMTGRVVVLGLPPTTTSTPSAIPSPTATTPGPPTRTYTPTPTFSATTCPPSVCCAGDSNDPQCTTTPGPPTRTYTPTPTFSATTCPPSVCCAGDSNHLQCTTTPGPPTRTYTPTPTSTPCLRSFPDVPGSYIFYDDIIFLACRGVINGYADGNFRPNGNTTRGEVTKIIVSGFGIPLVTPPATPRFVDVPANHPFYLYVETLVGRQVVSGFPDGNFRPNGLVTRAQLAKIVVGAGSYTLATPTVPTFSDVPSSNVFWQYIETLNSRAIISGAACGSGLCYRPNDSIKRGELSKVVHRAIDSTPLRPAVVASFSSMGDEKTHFVSSGSFGLESIVAGWLAAPPDSRQSGSRGRVR